MSVSVLNPTASLGGKTLTLLENTQTFTGQKTFNVGASAPFVVAPGAAKVVNLDADKLDGEDGAAFHNAALLTGTVPGASVNLTNLNASNLTSGTVPDARFPATLPAVSGAQLTGLPTTLGPHDIWISARGMRPHPTWPAQQLSDVLMSADRYVSAIPFPDAFTAIYFEMVFPKSWDESSIYWAPYWFNTTGGAGTVYWDLYAAGHTHGSGLINAYGSLGACNDPALAAKLMTTGTFAGGVPSLPYEMGMVSFLLYRNTAGPDTYTGTAYLIGLRIRITTNAHTDA